MSLRRFIVFLLMLPASALAEDSWRGVDLSYVNELEDCGAEYRQGDAVKDPYEILADAGANIVRLRLWVNPDWTSYSTFDDVRKSLKRAKEAGMRTLLDFHYSDDWAHPGKQLRPELEQRWKHDQIADDGHGDAKRQQLTQARHASVRREREAPEARDGGLGTEDHGVRGTRPQQVRVAWSGVPRAVNEMNAGVDADSEQQRQHDDVREVEGKPEDDRTRSGQ